MTNTEISRATDKTLRTRYADLDHRIDASDNEEQALGWQYEQDAIANELFARVHGEED